MGTKPREPKASDFTGNGGGRALELANEKYAGELARWEKGIEVDAPTIAQPLKWKLLQLGFRLQSLNVKTL